MIKWMYLVHLIANNRLIIKGEFIGVILLNKLNIINICQIHIIGNSHLHQIVDIYKNKKSKHQSQHSVKFKKILSINKKVQRIIPKKNYMIF
jgi:hypothetical protein